MKKLILIFLVGLLYTHLPAQESSISQGAETINIGELRDHIYYLASDELEGRSTGTPGFEIAMEYAVIQLRQAGLIPMCKTNDSKLSYYQDIPINRLLPGTNNQVTIIKNLNERTFTFEKNYVIICANPLTIKEFSGGLAFIGAGIREPEYGIDDYKNIDVKGKWVVVWSGEESFPIAVKKKLPEEILQKYKVDRSEKWEITVQNAKDAGAIGVISLPIPFYPMKVLAANNHEGYILPGIRKLFWDYSIPILVIDSTMVNYLFNGEKYNPLINNKSYKRFMLGNTILKLHKEYDLSPVNAANVVALIEGSDPILKNEYITIGAHIDHLGIWDNEVMNGADDNASGCAAVIEIAEALAKFKLKRSIICILFTGEESGELGSLYFTENPPVPLKNIHAYINLDMIGRPDGIANEFDAIGSDRINPKLKEIISKVNDKTLKLNLDTLNYNNYYNRSDQYPFYLKRIPAVCFTSGEHRDYHTPADDPEKIDYVFLQKNCQLVYEIILELANEDISLKK